MITQINKGLPLEQQAGLAHIASSHPVKKKKTNTRGSDASGDARSKALKGADSKKRRTHAAEMASYFDTGRKKKREHKNK